MRRVYSVYALRIIFSRTALEGGLLLVAGVWIASYVSLGNVLLNMPSPAEVTSFINFAKSAFTQTEFIVQILTLLALSALVLFVLDIGRSIREISLRAKSA